MNDKNVNLRNEPSRPNVKELFYAIKDLPKVTIFTKASFLKEYKDVAGEKDPSIAVVSLGRRISPSTKNIYFPIFEPTSSFVIVGPTVITGFIALYFDSTIGKAKLLVDNKSDSLILSRDLLSEIIVPRLSQKGMWACATLQLLIGRLASLSNNKSANDASAPLMLLSSVREYVVMEMLIPEFFKNANVNILNSWIELLDSLLEENPYDILDNDNNEINTLKFGLDFFDQLVTPGNKLMENMNKMKVFINDFTKHLTDPV